MNATTPAHTRRRTTLVAVTLAVLVGTGSLIFATGRDAAPTPATPERAAAAVTPADVTAAPVAATFAAPAPVAVTSVDPAADATASADPAAVEDPFADVIVEAVDPAEALFGDQAAVAVSN